MAASNRLTQAIREAIKHKDGADELIALLGALADEGLGVLRIVVPTGGNPVTSAPFTRAMPLTISVILTKGKPFTMAIPRTNVPPLATASPATYTVVSAPTNSTLTSTPFTSAIPRFPFGLRYGNRPTTRLRKS